MGQREVVGVLLIHYKGGGAPQPIQWVRLSDVDNLRNALSSHADQTARAASIRAQITALRSRGVTDAQLAASGIDVQQFEQMATTAQTWPLISYQLLHHPATGAYLRFNRVHQLQTAGIDYVQLVQRRMAETP